MTAVISMMQHHLILNVTDIYVKKRKEKWKQTHYYQDGLLVLGGLPSLVSLLKVFGQHAEKLNLKTRLRDHLKPA